MDLVVNGTRLSYAIGGGGRPLVGLHGLGLNMDLFRKLTPLLGTE